MRNKVLLLFAVLLTIGCNVSAQEIKWRNDNRRGSKSTVYGYRLYNERTDRWVSYIFCSSHNDYILYNGLWYYLGKDYQNGLWGVLCSTDPSKWYIEPQYNEITRYYNGNSHGCIAVKKGQDWGVLDLSSKEILLDTKYQRIVVINNDGSVHAISWDNTEYRFNVRDLRNAVIAKQERDAANARRLAAAQAEEKRIRAEAEQQERIRQQKEEKLKSFTKYATAYVQPQMTDWQKKGEFEKVSDYQRRVSGENRQRKIDELTREAEILFLQENSKNINLTKEVLLQTYDSENEVFSLLSKRFDQLLIPVPIDEGPAFKQGFNNATISNEKYFVENDKIALASFDITISGKTYHYSNNNALNYSQYSLNPDALDLPAINIVTGNSNASMRKPKVQILSPQNGSQYQDGTVTFRINVVPGDGIKPVLYVEINGAEAVELQPVDQNSKGARLVEGKLYEIKLPTEPGKSVNLAFTARDEQNVTSETQKVKLTYAGQVVKPKLILFAVGVGNYPSTADLTKLRYAAKDARDFTSTIEGANLEDYTSLVKHVYIDNDATRKNVNAGMRQLMSEASQGDVVMFYFSGHGVQDGSETYFMTIDASQEAPSDGVSFADLKNNMRKLTERQVKVVAFMDACHAGAMVGAKGAAPKLTELDVENVIEFYSSTKGEESAEDETLQNGVFTAALVSGLNGAAANKDGYITVNTLRTYITDYVREHNSRQTPMFKGVDAGDITLFHKK